MKKESQKVRPSWSQIYVVSEEYVLNADRNIHYRYLYIRPFTSGCQRIL